MSAEVLITESRHENGNGVSAPVMDVLSCSSATFEEHFQKLKQERAQLIAAGQQPRVDLPDGWHVFTPAMSKRAWLSSKGNRVIGHPAVKALAHDMINHDWQETGESVIFQDGHLSEGHTRMLASYFSGESYETFLVNSKSRNRNLFAYINQGRKRSNADALAIAGWNGSGRVMAQAIAALALRYDEGALGVITNPRFRRINTRDCLEYLESHPDFQEAARSTLASYIDALAAIRSKPAGVFFAWRVIRDYSEAVLADFFGPLGSGANLTEDSPILAVRNKLLASEEGEPIKMYPRTRLAYVIKAFRMHVAGQTMPRRGRNERVQPLTLALDEPFPRIEPTTEPTEQ